MNLFKKIDFGKIIHTVQILAGIGFVVSLIISLIFKNLVFGYYLLGIIVFTYLYYFLLLVYFIIMKIKEKIAENREKRNIIHKIAVLQEAPANSICFICKESFMEIKDQIAQCSKCKTYFHYEHLKEHLLTESTCPKCKRKIEF